MSNSSDGIKLKIGKHYKIFNKTTNTDMGIYKLTEIDETPNPVTTKAKLDAQVSTNDINDQYNFIDKDKKRVLINQTEISDKYQIQEISPLEGYKDRDPDTGEEIKGGKKSQRRRRKSKRKYRNLRYTRKK